MERERKRDQKDRQRDQRERETRNRRGVDVVATKVTAPTVPKPGVTSSRLPFEE